MVAHKTADRDQDGAEGVWMSGIAGRGLEVCADEFERGHDGRDGRASQDACGERDGRSGQQRWEDHI